MVAKKSNRELGDSTLDPDQELFALGIANVGGSFFQAMPSGGGTSQTTENAQVGAKTQLAGIITDSAVAMVLFLAPLIGWIPAAALGCAGVGGCSRARYVQECKAILGIRQSEF